MVEIVYTRLHAGGKFDKGAGSAYSFSGGLHGVGVSVTNALAKRLQVASFSEGQVATLAFAGGDVAEPLRQRIRHGHADPMQAARERIRAAGPLVELAAGVQAREHDFHGGRLFDGVRADGNAAAVVFDAHRSVGVHRDVDALRESA